jgi:trk system potassium uptake protein
MQYLLIQRLIGIFLISYGATLIPPILISLWYDDGEAIHFVYSQLLALGLGVAIWLPVQGICVELRIRDGFMVVALF